ncbi:MAG: HNH endonuclease [Syntrophaceae bacterium]|nr:HNH endonuclease [Syntrophaceae bacterium]
MGFSKEIRTKVLIAAARHCCVCHRYKGVKVEVHHIIPEADGGDDSFENAIALCFDCHNDAGHYNNCHPRGSKFSPRELRLARDTWYKIVSEKYIHPPSEPDHFYCRYLICKDFEILKEIADRNLSRLPIRDTVLVENATLGFLKHVLNAHNEKYRRAHEWGVGYSDEKAYLLAHPDAVKIDKKVPGFAYYDMIRTPSYNELRERVVEKDGITRLLLSEGVSSEEIARALAFWDYCGGTTFQEEYRLRPLWGAFLAATNIMEAPIVIESLEGFTSGMKLGNLRSFTSSEEFSESEWRLPASPLSPGMTAIIPVATVLAPLHHVPEHAEFTSSRDLDNGEIQEFKHVQFEPESINSPLGPRHPSEAYTS